MLAGRGCFVVPPRNAEPSIVGLWFEWWLRRRSLVKAKGCVQYCEAQQFKFNSTSELCRSKLVAWGNISYKSFHSGFKDSISLTFLRREPAFNCVSLSRAGRMLACSSK